MVPHVAMATLQLPNKTFEPNKWPNLDSRLDRSITIWKCKFESSVLLMCIWHWKLTSIILLCIPRDPGNSMVWYSYWSWLSFDEIDLSVVDDRIWLLWMQRRLILKLGPSRTLSANITTICSLEKHLVLMRWWWAFKNKNWTNEAPRIIRIVLLSAI